MPTRRIFISHSTKGEPGLKLLTAVTARLDARKYELLLDRKNLVPGEDWYQTVSEWMMACSGAILLLNKDAERSPYVQYEASILSHRWRTDGAFKLFVALVDPTDGADRLTRSKLSQGALGATRISQVHVWSAPTSLLNDPDGLADALIAETTFGDPTFNLTTWDRMVDAVAKCLIGIDPGELETAAEASQTNELLPLFDKLTGNILMRAVAAWLLETSVSDLPRVHAFVAQFRASLETRRRVLLQSIRAAEAHWLPSGVGNCPIANSVAASGSGAAVALNGKFVKFYTLECFVQRALGPYEECLIIRCDAAAQDEESVVLTIKQHCDPLEPDLLDDRDIANQLRNRRTVCLLQNYPKAPNDDELIKALRARFRYIVFAAWPGPKLPDGLSKVFSTIDPAVDLVTESIRRADWSAMKAMLDQSAPPAGSRQ